MGCRARNHESTSPRVDETQADGGIMVRARGVSVSLLGRAGDSHPPVLHWGTAPARVGFRAEVSRRMAVKRHGPDRGVGGLLPPLPLVDRWRAVGERRDGRTRTGSLVPVKNILCRSRVDRGAKATTCGTEPGAGPTTAAVPCAGSSRQDRVGWTPSCRGGPGRDGDVGSPPTPPLAHWLAGCPDRSVPNSSTHARQYATC